MARDTIFTLQNLIAWLETQPGETEYEVVLPTRCLFGQFGKAHGSHYGDVSDALGMDLEIAVAWTRPRTYANALQRARALLPAKPDTTEAVERLKDEALAVAAAGHREPIGEL